MGAKNLPLDSGQRIADIFVEFFGWQCAYGKNHWVLTHPEKSPHLFLSIPNHRTVDRYLLRAELRKAGISEEEFCAAYKKR